MTSEELADLDVGALRRLIDRQAIIDCVHRYARGVDRGDAELLGSAYHEDATEDHAGGYIGPVDGLLPFLEAAHAPFPGYQRYVSNFTIEIDGDEAHSECYYLCVLRSDGGTMMLSGGRYVDRLERRDGEWRIAARVVVIEWGGAFDGGLPGGASVQPRRDRDDVSYQRPLTVDREPTAPPASAAP